MCHWHCMHYLSHLIRITANSLHGLQYLHTYMTCMHTCKHTNILTDISCRLTHGHIDTQVNTLYAILLRLLLFHSFRHVFVVFCFIIVLIHRCMLSFIVSLRYSFYHVIECNRVCLHVSMHVFIHILRHIYLYYIHTDAMQTLIDA